MIIAIDIGNSSITIGCIDACRTYLVEHISTSHSKTDLEYAITIKNILELYNIPAENLEGGILSSVVPPLTGLIRKSVEKLTHKSVMVVGPGVKTGLNIKIDNPAQLGSDLVVDAVAAVKEYPLPLIIIDMGTATAFSVIDQNGVYIGGAIAPGIRISVDSLTSKTSQLPRISLDPPKYVIGKNTVDCMKSGAVLGSAAMVDGMLERMEETLQAKPSVVATGGLAPFIIPHCRHNIIYDETLSLKGLWIIYSKNKGC